MTQTHIRIINQLHIDIDAERQKLVAGLRANNATIEPKYFYDEMGCAYTVQSANWMNITQHALSALFLRRIVNQLRA